MELSPDRSYIRPQKSLSIFMKTETTSSIFSEHNDMKLEINYKKKILKKIKYVEIRQYAITEIQMVVRYY